MVKNLITKKSFLIFLLVFFAFLQLIYSFLFPAVGLNESWQKVSAYLPKFNAESQDSALLNAFLPIISSEYRLNSDVSHYLETGRYFNPEFFENSPVLSRPLYPFLIFLSSTPFRIFIGSSYGIIFAFAIAVNFILLTAGVILFFLLLKKIFSLKIAFLSSVLLIFSPFAHTALVQPRADILALFAVAASAYLLQKYASHPSKFKLVLFSLIVGILLLGKIFYALPFFILLSAVYFRRYKEGAYFFLIHLVPMVFWYLWVTKIWQIPFYAHEINYYQNDLIWHIFSWPWFKAYGVILSALPNFIETLIYGFLLIPVIFSAIGWQKLPLKSKNIFYLGSIFSVFLFSFLTSVYYPRIAFFLFPIIYPTCILGIERIADFLKKYGLWLGPVFYATSIGSIIFVSSINFYKIFFYL